CGGGGGGPPPDTVSRAIAEAGIADLSAVFLDRTTPSYTALIDREGELLVGFADMALYELAFAKQIRRSRVREEIAAADAVLCDANLPSAALERLASLAAGKPVFAIAISPAKVVRLKPVLGGLAVAFMNRREAVALAGLDDAASQKIIVDGLRSAGLDSAVVTAGGSPVLGFDRDGSFAVVPPPPRKIVDVTGAGDALAGATVAALLRDMPLRAALREGVAAATLAIESAGAVPDFTTATFAQALALVPDEQEMA
ncbi:PfkB family carbohydrate kinase, partial [Mesorhizobium sp. B294B1A1]|uniref:PfkB family carbohydrate kinase n=1 Tax=Mesorhizobium sp. B294B1A1 TaxID=2876663 RepID=UPI001CD161EF